MQQESMAQAGYGTSSHLEACHSGSVIPPFQWHLHQLEELQNIC